MIPNKEKGWDYLTVKKIFLITWNNFKTQGSFLLFKLSSFL